MVDISTGDFPQADRLATVALVPLAIAAGLHSDKEIEKYIGLASDGRQGRYYRLAAHLLGLVRNDQNHAELTPFGAEYANLAEAQRQDYLALRVAQHPVMSLAARFIHEKQPTLSQFRDWLRSVYPGEESTSDRRSVTIRAWLIESGLVVSDGDRLTTKKFLGTIATEFIDEVPAAQPHDKPTKGLMTYEVDLQKLERANFDHQRLVDCAAARLTKAGVKPVQNGVIDLYGEASGERIIFEMKTVHEKNYGSQIRKAVSQLYEYRYLHGFGGSRLCIVTNEVPGYPPSWVESYLTDDREIAVLQTADFTSLAPLGKCQHLLGPF
jgi:hypothetical protein